MYVGQHQLSRRQQWQFPCVLNGFKPETVLIAAWVAMALLTPRQGWTQALLPLQQQPPSFVSPVPQGSPIPRILPPAPPAVAPGSLPASPPAGTTVPNEAVRVTDIAIQGATAFSLTELQPHTAGLEGPDVPLSRIEAARQAILQEYRTEGFVLTTVSANLDKTGRLRFIVTEGRIASIKLDGDIGPAGTQVLRFLDQLTLQTPIRSATLERFLLLAQDVPGISLRAVLEPSLDEPGALNLIAQVSRKAVSGVVTFDNRAFDQTGPIEGLGVLDLNSFTALGERTEFSYYHTFPNSQNFGQISSEFFIGGSGLKMRIYAGRGLAVPRGNSTTGLQVFDYHGTTTVAGVGVSYPVIRSRQQTLNVSLNLDLVESEIDINPAGAPSQSADSLRVVRLGSDYAMSDLWFGVNHSAVNSVSVRLSRGFHALGASANGEQSAPRLNEQTDFTKLSAEVSRTQTLFTPWEGASVALMGLLTGQWSDDILPPVEQFYLGGSRFTRGYYAGQVPGDKALATTAELQLNTATDLSLFGFAADVGSQFYLFYDWGQVWQNRSSDFQTRVASAGGGVRLQVTSYAELDLEALGRFNRFPTAAPGQVGALNGTGLYWRILGRF
jgi:hemolysin activation/secretion protein